MRFRPSTEPPRLAQLVLALTTPADEREVLLSDLQDDYEERVAAEGTASARRHYRREALRSMLPGLGWRLGRLRRPRAGHRVSPRWRPAPLHPTDDYNRGDNVLDFLNDLRFGLRSLSKSPLVFAVVVVSLAIGIGATTTVFSIANAVLLRPPVADLPDDVIAIFTSEGDGELYGEISYPDYLDIRSNVDAIDGAFLHRLGGVEIEDDGGRRRLLVELVTGEFFELSRLELALGRGFSAEETPIGSAERLIVLSHRLWRQRYGADPEILGRTVRVDGHPYTVIGVGPPGYSSRFLGLQIDAWLPMGVPGGIYHVRPSGLADRADREYRMMAKLGPGEPLSRAAAQLTALARQLHGEHAESWTDHRGEARTLTALREDEARLPGDQRALTALTFGLILLLSGVILLIACSNAAALFLARSHRRRREMAVRLALGASRGRVLAMLLAESLIPALAAGLLGTFLAGWACDALGTLELPIAFPIQFDFHLDYRVLLFTFGLSLATSVLFGLAPALEGSRSDLVPALKADAGTGDRGGRRRPGGLGLRRILVVAQVAASLAFLLGAALALRGLQKITSLDPGIDIERHAVMSRDLPEDRFNDEATAAYFDELLGRLRRRGDVDDAQVATSAELTLFTQIHRAEIALDGYVPAEGETLLFSNNAVTPGYLEMIGVRLLSGRGFAETDRPGAPRVAVVNRAFAERFWPGKTALGKRFRLGRTAGGDDRPGSDPAALEIVGITENGRYAGLDGIGEPYFWTALRQDWSRRVLIHVRGRSSAEQAVQALRDEAKLTQGESVPILPMPQRELMAFELLEPKFAARMLGWGGLFGALLAVLGLYGVMAFTVRLRRREMAIRQALGARPGQVAWEVARDGLKLALWGIVAGLAVALPLAMLSRSLLYGLSPLDPLAIGGTVGLLLAAAFAASLVPTRHLRSGQPLTALREE